MNDYIEAGYETRKQYLESLSDQYDVDIEMVIALASLLGRDEDFDGLISALEDLQ